jgi:hypothetical protein
VNLVTKGPLTYSAYCARRAEILNDRLAGRISRNTAATLMLLAWWGYELHLHGS